LSKKTREELVQMLTKCLFEIDEMGGFHIAMATAGGVHLKEVNPTTMESRKQKGLYLIGEVLDVDGNTGGYNLQAAFSTAYLCAKSFNNKN
jgi:predicted flavoprotein YhiN